MLNWDYLRCFLAVAREGTTVAAAETMRVDQSTVSRQIVALERAVEAKLFHKSVTGYELTDLGRQLVPAAERAELEVSEMISLVAQGGRRIAGAIKVTTNETIADLFLTPSLREFAELYPEIRVHVSVSAHWLDLSRGEADVALRAARVLKGEGVEARKLSDLPWGIYCSQDYLGKHGSPARAKDLRKHRIISVDGDLATIAGFQWLEKNAGSAAVVSRTDSLPNLLAGVRAGLGVSALPCVTGEAEPELARCLGPDKQLDSSVWLVTRSQIKDEPRIQAFNSFVTSKAPELRRLLTVPQERQD
jgi:DNA-binding transcriptional LysR family regulator